MITKTNLFLVFINYYSGESVFFFVQNLVFHTIILLYSDSQGVMSNKQSWPISFFFKEYCFENLQIAELATKIVEKHKNVFH